MKKWYVVQVFAGYENVVKNELERSIKEHNLQDIFGEILIPSAKMKQLFDAGDVQKDQQLFPGYVIIEMEATPEAIRLVSNTPRIVRFLGGQKPAPLATKEIEKILAQIRGEVPIAQQEHKFELGKEVDIKEGPFAGFVGIIDTINEENEKLTVMVSIFGRMTPVELSFDQVKQ